jgi:hypothetical protein
MLKFPIVIVVLSQNECALTEGNGRELREGIADTRDKNQSQDLSNKSGTNFSLYACWDGAM